MFRLMQRAAFAQPRFSRRLHRRRGFTLMEAAIVSVIIGVGIMGLMQLLAAGTMANAQSVELTTGIYLANNIDEMLQGKPYATLKATYDNKTYGPPIDGAGATVSGFSGWRQIVTVKYVDHNLITSLVPETQYEPTCRVTVRVEHNGMAVYTARWIVASAS
jgi:prepilin-type N-terminal cleavage/methylation domain-containing protein